MTDNEKHARLHIGLRNVKTGLSVLVCVLLYHFLGREGVTLAAVSAIICMQDNVEKSLERGFNRLYGTSFGAVLGMVFLSIANRAGFAWLTMALITAGVMLLILLCNALKHNDAIIIGCIVFLVIMIAEGQAPLLYSANRLLDTTIGVFTAIAINRFIGKPPGQPKTEELGEDDSHKRG